MGRKIPIQWSMAMMEQPMERRIPMGLTKNSLNSNNRNESFMQTKKSRTKSPTDCPYSILISLGQTLLKLLAKNLILFNVRTKQANQIFAQKDIIEMI
ncbi:hypothetical protein BpHYR1_001271 [Brachionus plicatilis]|uniref:Uncharacterized protein n=1 Tax=Brachionus plicatilis TaxID=10195 RepID=A0A3M7RA84_BRAPC|nr:hypothetical protein BpHYR1_001271 [Brachionus plicatilis]